MFEKIKDRGYEILALNHGEAILKHDMPDAIDELEKVLLDTKISTIELVCSGGGESKLTQRLRIR